MSAKAPKPLKALIKYADIVEKPVWGPVFWKVLHLRARDHGLTERWLDGFEAAIICPDCKEHFSTWRARHPREVYASDEAWTWAAHNAVNTERSNKPFYSWAEYQRHRDD